MTTRAAAVERIDGTSIRRFDIHQRLQHILMFSSFIILAGTGLPLKFSEWASSHWWMGVWGGVEVTRGAHQVAAWMMIAACVYHVVYIVVSVTVWKRPFPKEMLPRLKDFRDLVQDVKFNFGLTKDAPKFDRFSYREKFDYWAVFWGILIMVGGGLVLMFPVAATKVFPGWTVPFALVAHSDEAILAIGWILIVHMFFAHLAPKIFPMNKSIFTGKVPIRLYREEHPLEFARIVAAATVPIPAEAEMAPPVPAGSPAVEEPGATEPA